MSKILIFGATGNVGSKVVRELLEKDMSLRLAVRDIEKAKKLGFRGLELIHFNYSESNTFKKVFHKIEKVLFIAPPGHPNSFNLLKPSIDYAIKGKVKHIVLLSALGVDADDNIPIRKIELYIEKSGIPYTFVRPTFFMQNFTIGYLSEGINQNYSIKLPAGNGKTSFIDTRDIASVIAHILTKKGHKNKIYELTGKEALDHYEIASILSELYNQDIKYYDIIEEEMIDYLKSQGLDEDRINFMINLYKPVKNGFTAKITNAVHEILGREPFSFREFVEDYLNERALSISNQY